MSRFVCKYNFDKECIIGDCDKCKEHPMYQQGRADERTKTIEEFVKAMESIDKQSGGLGIDIIDVWDVAEELKEKKNGKIYRGNETKTKNVCLL